MAENTRITYRKVGDYIIPNLILSPKEKEITLGKWGMMYKNYLRRHKEVHFNSLVMNGILYQHCAEIEQQAKELFSRLVDDMTKAEGVTEQLKAENQMEWVGKMENIELRAREIVCEEIIFA